MELIYTYTDIDEVCSCNTVQCHDKKYFKYTRLRLPNGRVTDVCDGCLPGMELKTPSQYIYHVIVYPSSTLEIYKLTWLQIHSEDMYQQYRLVKL